MAWWRKFPPGIVAFDRWWEEGDFAADRPACLARLKQQGQSILVIDKSVAALTRLADRHYLIERGRNVWTGTSEELLADEAAQARYLGV